MKLSKFTLFLGIFIIFSAYFIQDAWNAWKVTIGKSNLILVLTFLYLWAFFTLVYRSIKSSFSVPRAILVGAISVLGLIFALRQPYPQEKAHVLEYGLLAWLAMRDLSKNNKNILKTVLRALIFVSIISFLEEGFQKFLPWRVFEIKDIGTNILGGILGIILFIVK